MSQDSIDYQPSYRTEMDQLRADDTHDVIASARV
jgi:hypothetical protein